MRPIDADALMDDIKRDSKKAIKEGDKVGSFWLGYIAGLVIKQPTIQSALDPETLIRTIETGITATNTNDAYSLGMRNGMRWCKSLIDGVEPKFEDDVMSVDDGKELPTVQPEPTDINAKEAVYNLAEKIGIHQLFALTVELRGEPIQPEPHWIPCNERLPEDYTDVLVWFEYFRYGDYNCLYQTHGIGTYFAEYNSWMINHESGWKDLRVIAWMPLPKPYKPNKE